MQCTGAHRSALASHGGERVARNLEQRGGAGQLGKHGAADEKVKQRVAADGGVDGTPGGVGMEVLQCGVGEEAALWVVRCLHGAIHVALGGLFGAARMCGPASANCVVHVGCVISHTNKSAAADGWGTARCACLRGCLGLGLGREE